MKPQPCEITVCTLCNLPWRDHVARVVDETRCECGGRHTERAPRAVDASDCVALLLVANQGPPGPTGAMGPTGMPGRDAL